MAEESQVGIGFNIRADPSQLNNLNEKLNDVITSSQGLTDIIKQVIDLSLKEGMSFDQVSQAVKSVAGSAIQAKEAMQQYGIVVVSQTEMNNAYYKDLFNNLAMEKDARSRMLSDAKALYLEQVEVEKAAEQAEEEAYRTTWQLEMDMLKEKVAAEKAAAKEEEEAWKTSWQLELDALKEQNQAMMAERARFTQMAVTGIDPNRVSAGTSAVQDMFVSKQGLSNIQEAKTLLTSLGYTAQEQSAIFEKLGFTVEESMNKGGTAIHSAWSQSFLFFGVAMMVNSAIQQIAASQDEKANPAMMQFGRVMQEVSAGAMVGMMSGMGVAGMLAGALGGALLGVGIATLTVTPQVAELNKQLDTLAKKDDVINALADIAKVSYAEAEAMMVSAKASPEAAKALQQYVDSARGLSGTERTFDMIGASFGAMASIIKDKTGGIVADIDIQKEAARGLLEYLGGDYFAKSVISAVEGYDKIRQVQADMAKAAFDAVAPTASLNAELQNITKKGDAVDVLSQLSGLTKEQSANALEAAKNNADYARVLQDAKTAYDQATIAVEKLEVLQKNGVDVTDQLTRAQKAQADALQSVQNAASNLANVYYQLEQAQKAADTAAGNLNDAIAKDSQDALKLQADSQKKVADAAQQAADQTAKDNRALADRLSDIAFQRIQTEMRANEEIAKDFRSLSDKEYDIQRSLGEKQSEEYRSYQKTVESINNDIAKQQQDLANKILEINKKEIEDLQNLDYDTAKNLQGAKTENERMAIEEEAMHKRALIRQGADDQRDSAEKSVAQSIADSEKKKSIALEEYNYKKKLNEQQAADQRADAERTYREQVADINQRLAAEEASINRQVYEAKRGNAEQLSDLQKKLSQEIQDTITAALDKAKTWRNETMALATEYANRLSLAMQYARAINQLSMSNITGTVGGGAGVQLGGGGGSVGSQISNNYGGNKANIVVNNSNPEYIIDVLKKYLSDLGIGQVS